MKQLLLDTNILLDVLAKRDPYYREAVELFNMGLAGKVQLSVSALSLVNIHYILKRQLKEQGVRAVLTDLSQFIRVLPLDASICERSLPSEIKDFEDASQTELTSFSVPGTPGEGNDSL